MITFEPTSDERLVRDIMLHHTPTFYNVVCGETPDNFIPPMQSYVVRLLVREGVKILGLIWMVPWSTVCWEMHSCLLPKVWGFTRRIFDEFKRFVWGSLAKIQRVMMIIPECNHAAVACALRNGVDYVGFNPNSIVRDGVLMGNHMMGISRPEGI